MNTQEIRSKQTNNARNGGAPAQNPPQRRRPNPALLRLLRNAMLLLAAMIVVVGLLLLILPTFRVQTVTVKGNSFYTEEQILEASGIREGQELLGIDVNAVCQSIWDSCIYVNEVSIKLGLNSVTIEITERSNILYTEFGDRYFSIDASDFRVLEKSSDESVFADFIKVELPRIASLSVGEPLNFENSEADLSYIGDLLDALARADVLSSVSFLNLASKYHVSYVMNQSCRVNLGRVTDLEDKLATVRGILEMKGDLGGLGAVVDVTDLEKPTFRPLGESELLLVK